MQPAADGRPAATQNALTQDEALYWLALRLTPGLGTRKAGQLLEVFRTPKAIFRASRSELQAAGLSGGVAQSLSSGCAFDDAADQQRLAIEAGVFLISVSDPSYPPSADPARHLRSTAAPVRAWQSGIARNSHGGRGGDAPPHTLRHRGSD